jgi:hypothetical protein
MSIEKRIKAIEDRLNMRSATGGGKPFRIIVITGCLPIGPPRWAYAGPLQWERGENEELEQFSERCAAAAIAAGETLLTIGGLPRGEEEMASFATFEEWWAARCAPFYDEVPPCEGPGYERRSSSYGGGF